MPMEALVNTSCPPISNGCASSRWHPIRHPPGRSRVVESFDQESELVTAEARDGIAGAADPIQPARDGDQELVSGAVSHRVVHQLEPVQIEKQHGEPAAQPSPGPRLGLAQSLHEQGPVGKPGERVVERRAPQALLGADAFGHVVRDHQPRRAAGEIQRVRGDLHVDGVAAGLAVPQYAGGRLLLPARRELLLGFQGLTVGSHLRDGHRPELVPRVTVVIDGRLVHRQEPEGLLVVDPHGERASIEEEAVPLLGCAQRLEREDALASVAVRRVFQRWLRAARSGVERSAARRRNVGKGARLEHP